MKNICQNLNKFYDQELDMQKRKEFVSHLSNCPSCQKKLRFLQDLAKISRPKLVSAPVGGWQFVSHRLNKSYEFGHLWWQKMTIAACFMLFTVAGSISGNYYFEDYSTTNLTNNSIYSYLEENL